MLVTLAGAGLLSKETGIQKNTESTPDELMRVNKEKEEALKQQQEMMEQRMVQQPTAQQPQDKNKKQEEE